MTAGADEDPENLPEDTDIRPLDEQTVAQIAAGEVVERPASVAKELVENSLDADASRIEVAVENGGIDGVTVTDDGVGMSEADLRASVREHTTSKLEDAGELERVRTLGFRGEALHTIGAVSKLTVTSKPRADRSGDADSDAPSAHAPDTGTRLRYEGGDVVAVEPAPHPEGTTVAVEELFYNTPARRKYLSESSTEFRHVSRVVGRYALANPEVAVSLTHDGSEVWATPGDGDRRSAVLAVYGREVAESMLEVDAEPDVGAVERVAGLVSAPETTRASRDYLATYVDDRYVEPDVVRSAVVEAYGGQLAADRYPFAVLFVDVPRDRVDVNVHPRKLAVRFDDEDAVREAVTDAVREALLDAGIVRSSAPRGVSAPEEATVEPTTLDEAGAAGEGDDQAADDATLADGEEADEAGPTPADAEPTPAGSEPMPDDSERTPDEPTPSSPETRAPDAASSDPSVGDAGATTDEAGAETDTDGTPDETTSTSARSTSPRSRTTPSASSSQPVDVGRESDAGTDHTSDAGSHRPSDAGGHRTSDADRRFDAAEQRSLDDSAASPTLEGDRLPSMRVLGQLAGTYVVAETDDGLVLLDQHAADERIHYERLRDAVDDGNAQVLAEPVELPLTPEEAATVEDLLPALERLGFHADRDGDALEVRSVPTVLDEQLPPAALRDVLADLRDGGDGAGTVEALAEELLADLACAPAVTSNTSLTEGSVADLLAALDDCENPFECPHGRPTIVRIDADELAERFERDYPGHGTRRE